MSNRRMQETAETRKKLEAADGLIAARKYAEAAHELERVSRSSLEPKDRAFYCILKAETALYLGDYTVNRLIEEALTEFGPRDDTAKFARAKFLQGWLFTSLGRHLKAKEALMEAYVSYQRCGEHSGSARAINQLSYVMFQLGDINAAVRNLETCLDIYQQLGEGRNHAVISMNLASLYLRAGRLHDSLRQYRTIASQIGQPGERNHVIFQSMTALLHALLGDMNSARQTLDSCEPFREKFAREKAIYYENKGVILWLDGDYESAGSALEKALEVALEIAPDSALVAQIKRHVADLHISLGRIEGAEKFAREALATSEHTGERAEIAACYRVFAQVDKKDGRKEKAREWFKKAIGLFEKTGARHELAVTQYQAATANVFRGDERAALLYLAREYFAREGLAHMVAAIDTELSRKNPSRSDSAAPDDTGPIIVTVDPNMRSLVSLARRIAASDLKVMLTGPAGSGKDLLAQYIHHWGRPSGEFVVVEAAELTAEQVQAVLFGRQLNGSSEPIQLGGLLDRAAGGTLYISELADISSEFQSGLLDVLHEEERDRFADSDAGVRPVRIISASSRDLQQEVAEGRLRADLYHRLREIPIQLPALEQRAGDIPALTRHMLTQVGYSPAAGEDRIIERLGRLLAERDWPENIRDLQREVRRLASAADGDLAGMVALAEQDRASRSNL